MTLHFLLKSQLKIEGSYLFYLFYFVFDIHAATISQNNFFNFRAKEVVPFFSGLRHYDCLCRGVKQLCDFFKQPWTEKHRCKLKLIYLFNSCCGDKQKPHIYQRILI